MKKTKFILKVVLLSMFFSVITVHVFSQKVTLSYRDVPFEKILNSIKKQTKLSIVFSEQLVNVNRRVTINVTDVDIQVALKQLLDNTNIDFEVNNNKLYLIEKKPLRQSDFNTKTDSKSESRKVTGVVTDTYGEPIVGATILVKNDATRGTISKIDGSYQLADIDPTMTLMFSYVGMVSHELVVNDRTKINVILIEDAELLDELVVVGYGTMKKSDVNAAISSIKAENLVTVSSPEIAGLLQGRAAGITVVPGTAQPGGWVNILIRGAASTGAGNDPLYVIDGFPVVNSSASPGSGNQWTSGSHSALSDINPNDIESIEILKDASATAIYGARGANGVILITTKRGSKGTKVDYSFSTSIQTIAKKPELLNASELMIEQERYYKERYLIDNKVYPYGDTDIGSIPQYMPTHTQEQIDNMGVGTNWYDQITRNGKITQHNFSVKYGNENIKSYFSVNVFEQEGIVKTSGFERFNLRLNLDHKVSDRWNYGVSSLASLSNEDMATLGSGRDATAGIIESAMNYNPRIVPERDPVTGVWIEDTDQGLLNHPLSYLDIHDKTRRQRFLSSIYSNLYLYKKELWVKLSVGADVRNGTRRNYYPKTMRYGAQIGGDANINSTFREDYIGEVLLNFNKKINNTHNLMALAGYSYQELNGDGHSARATGFSSDALMYYNLSAGQNIPEVSSYKNRHLLISYFSRIQYSYLDKYIFTLNARVDGSDRFGKNNRYAFFPSAALAWRTIQEDFLNNIDWLHDLKVRVSLGQVGNENIGNGSAISYYSYNGSDYYFGDSRYKGMQLAKLPNPDLKWETTTEGNLGVDFGFFKNRIYGSVDVYYKQIKDLLSYRRLPYGSIVDGVMWNVGKTQSKGAELSISTINIEKPFFWETTFTFTSYRDNWLERDTEVILQPYHKQDAPLTAIYTLEPIGLLQPGEFYAPQPNLIPGQEKFKDISGLDENGNLTYQPDGKIDNADVTFLGTAAPKFNVGLNNSFKYKNLDLNFFLYASVGAHKWPSTLIEHSVYSSYGLQQISTSYNFLKEIQNRWSSDNMTSEMPNGIINTYQSYGNPRYQDATFLRLKNLSLGYTFNDLFKSALNARFYFTGQNLFTLTNYTGLDPEVENNRAAYPQQRTFSFGLDLKF